MRGTLEERFWVKVDKRGLDDCWEWTGAKNIQGYGHIGAAGKTLYAHRVAWELANGPIPKGNGYHGTCVCHTCDNPGCVNPAHLFIGTNTDNLHDMIDKGRDIKACGEVNGMAILTEQDVREIRVMLARKIPQRVIAKKYGVSKGRISDINMGRTWARLK